MQVDVDADATSPCVSVAAAVAVGSSGGGGGGGGGVAAAAVSPGVASSCLCRRNSCDLTLERGIRDATEREKFFTNVPYNEPTSSSEFITLLFNCVINSISCTSSSSFTHV